MRNFDDQPDKTLIEAMTELRAKTIELGKAILIEFEKVLIKLKLVKRSKL